MLDISSATQRPKGMGPSTAPVSAQAPVTTGSCARTKAAATQPHAAPRMTLKDPEASVSTPMMSHNPTRLPMTISRLGQLMRLASTSLGTSTPAAFARSSRNPFRKPFCGRVMRSVSGSRVERCKRVRTAWMVSVSSTRHVAATARSVPTTAAAAATAAARSRSVRVAGAEEEARRKSRSSGPCAVTTTVSGLNAPCEIPARHSTTTARRNWSMSSSQTSSPAARRVGAPRAGG